jgi:hypothetical protein
MLEEARDRLEDKTITEEQLWQLTPIYCLLDFHKDDFCKLVNAIGIDKWLDKTRHWERLDRAEQDLTNKERYLNARSRLSEIEAERIDLETIVNGYKPI